MERMYPVEMLLIRWHFEDEWKKNEKQKQQQRPTNWLWLMDGNFGAFGREILFNIYSR